MFSRTSEKFELIRARRSTCEHIQSSVWRKPKVWIRVTNSLELETVFNPSIKSRLCAPTFSLSTGLQSKDFLATIKSFFDLPATSVDWCLQVEFKLNLPLVDLQPLSKVGNLEGDPPLG